MKRASKIVVKSENQKLLTFSFDGDSPLYVCDIGWHKTPPLHAFGPAVRPYYLLHLIESGEGQIERNGACVRLVAGDAFLIVPDEVTTYRASEEEPWEYRWISFSGSFAPELVAATTDRLTMKYRKSGLHALRQALDDEACDPVNTLEVLLRVLSSVQTVDKRERTETEDVVAAALQYLENNYFQSVDIASLALSLGYSRAHFTTLFSKRTGRSPYQYLTDVRIDKAKEYLQNTGHTVEEIAFSVGFSCVGRFSELFKKHTGYPPLRYRKLFAGS